MQAGLTNFLNNLRASENPRVHPVFRLEIWTAGAVLWVIIALVWGAL
jgi:hypothetical protein